jgi:hypothetical protein
MQSNRAVFFWIARLYHTGALWLTSSNLSDVMHFVGCLTTGPSDIIVPVGITLLWRNHIIAPISVTSRPNFGSWISEFATIRTKKCLKILIIVACDKQKMALMYFLSGHTQNISIIMIYVVWILPAHSSRKKSRLFYLGTRSEVPFMSYRQDIFLEYGDTCRSRVLITHTST